MKFFNLHTHQYSNQEGVLELVNQYPQEFDATIPNYSIGIHPWHIVEDRIDSDLEIIESKLEDEKCLAVGECGLDKRIEIPMALQQMVFEKQLALAEKYKKPVVIHCVAAFQEVITIKKNPDGRITEIQNETGMRFPFSVGQILNRTAEVWACNNNFLMDGKDTCPDKKIFGVKTKDVPQGHEWRHIFPHKF